MREKSILKNYSFTDWINYYCLAKGIELIPETKQLAWDSWCAAKFFATREREQYEND